MNDLTNSTIAAIATPPGRGGIGIIRLSGSKSKQIAEELSRKELKPRYAHFAQFKNNERFIDEGLAIFFPTPNSFTGEDVVELQGHGGPVVQKMLLEACLELGARMAIQGEFSQRAFLNDRMDLAQAEAIADLIDAGTEAGVRAANRSLQGIFSNEVNQLQELLTHIRIFIEAAIDFPEEEIDFIGESDILQRIQAAKTQLEQLLEEAKRGVLISEGARIAIIGRPNAGKSSLLNLLARKEVAIVTDIAGTTRDAIEQQIDLDGFPVTFVDTAGLNDDPDQVEKIGIQRSIEKAKDADIILFVFDANQYKKGAKTDQKISDILGDYSEVLNTNRPVIYVANKIDLVATENNQPLNDTSIQISATKATGIDSLTKSIKEQLNLNEREPQFSARTRHVEALQQCLSKIDEGLSQYDQHQTAELLAEDLRLAQQELSAITGDMSADDLLGEIFSSFCIGK